MSISRLVGPGARRRGRGSRLAVLRGRGLLGLPRPLLRPRTRPRTGAPAQETLSQTNMFRFVKNILCDVYRCRGGAVAGAGVGDSGAGAARRHRGGEGGGGGETSVLGLTRR